MTDEKASGSEPKALVSPSDIAEFAGVTRAAVSNWRKRQKDFPAQVAGDGAKPLFDRAQVLRWLARHMEKTGRDVEVGGGRTEVWTALNAARGFLEMRDMPALVLWFAGLRKYLGLSDTRAWRTILAPTREATRADEAGRWANEKGFTDFAGWTPRFDAIPSQTLDLIIETVGRVPLGDLGDACDVVIDRVAGYEGKSAGIGRTNAKSTRLLVELARTINPVTVYDPACGSGSFLVELGRQMHAGSPVRLVGHDKHESAVRTARLRAFLRDIKVDLHRVDVLQEEPEPSFRADVVASIPPWGAPMDHVSPIDARWVYGTPPRNFSDSAWLQHTLAHLNEMGRGFLIFPAGVLFRAGAEREIRRNLLLAGCIEAVVGLPAGFVSGAGIAPVLLVLRTPQETQESRVLFIDAAESDDVETNLPAWLADPTSAGAPRSALVEIKDLATKESNLSPRAWVQIPDDAATSVAHAYWQSRTKTEDALASLRFLQTFPDSLKVGSQLIGARVMTIGEMEKEGLLRIRRGKSVKEASTEYKRHLLAPKDLGGRALDGGADADEKLDGLTRPYEVLVKTINSVAASLDISGGHWVGQEIWRLEVLNQDQLRPGYLASALNGTWNNRFLTGAAQQRASVRDLEVPVLPAEAQNVVMAVDLSVVEVVRKAQGLAEAAASMRSALLDAVRFDIDLGASSPDGEDDDWLDEDNEKGNR